MMTQHSSRKFILISEYWAICRGVSASVDMLIPRDSCEAGVRCWACLSGSAHWREAAQAGGGGGVALWQAT